MLWWHHRPELFFIITFILFWGEFLNHKKKCSNCKPNFEQSLHEIQQDGKIIKQIKAKKPNLTNFFCCTVTVKVCLYVCIVLFFFSLAICCIFFFVYKSNVLIKKRRKKSSLVTCTLFNKVAQKNLTRPAICVMTSWRKLLSDPPHLTFIVWGRTAEKVR